MSQVERIRLIARGRSSTVVLAKLHPKNNADAPILVAIKSSCPSIIEHEREILYHLEGCPQVIQSIDDNDHNTSEDLLLEYSSQGSLRKLLSSSGPLPERQVRLLTASILKGLAYIHKNGYVHCDLKPENLLLCSSTDIKIADFGFAKRAGEKSRGTTITYMAPECVIRDQYEAPMDVWALGCIVVEMLTRKIALKFDPYVKGITGLLNDIREGKAYPQIPTMTRLSEDGKDFLGKCFVREPKMRWTAEMLLEHPFVVGGGDDLEVEDDRKGGYFRYAGKLLGIFSRCLLSSD